MNNRGQTLALSILMAVMIFIFGTLFLNFIMPEVSITRGATSLDCSNTAISDGTKLTCLMVDLVVPYFFITVISIAGGYITSRFLV